MDVLIFAQDRNMGRRLRTIFTVSLFVAVMVSSGCTWRKPSKERALAKELSVLRSAIDQYILDKQEGPQSLYDLVTAGYLKSIPEDPITSRTDCWVAVRGGPTVAGEQQRAAITDVHSCSDQKASNGTAYSTW
jgi:general secretion pathway protein G